MNKKHTLIIGGTRGIGSFIVRAFSEEGHKVSVIGRHGPKQKVNNTDYWILDLLGWKAISKALAQIVQKNGKLSSLIFLQRFRGKEDDWAGEIGVSITATKNIIEQLSDKFDYANESSIVIVSSLAGNFIIKEQPLSYHVAKASLNRMAAYYAVALGHKGIRINCVSPGTVLKEESKEFYLKNKKLYELYELYKKITPLGRMCAPEDIANAILFLCSPKASFITGQNIIIDGGLYLQGNESIAREVISLNVPKPNKNEP